MSEIYISSFVAIEYVNSLSEKNDKNDDSKHIKFEYMSK